MKRERTVRFILFLAGCALFTLITIVVISIARFFSDADISPEQMEELRAKADKYQYENAVKLSLKDFSKKLGVVDFGIGVKIGISEEELQRLLGPPDSKYRFEGKTEYKYLFPPSGTGLLPEDRHYGSFKDAIRLASLKISLRDDKVSDVSLILAMQEKSPQAWPIIRIKQKPLAGCTLADLESVLGKSTNDFLPDLYEWSFAESPSEEATSRRYISVRAMFLREGKTLRELNVHSGYGPSDGVADTSVSTSSTT